MVRSNSGIWSRRLWLEIFVLANLTFLGPDIYLAHSINLFRHAAEYVPFVYSLLSPVVLGLAILAKELRDAERAWRVSGHFVGWTAVVIGVVGLVLHLESHFFQDCTISSLVYTAPFAAPLAYTGLGLLLIMNRMVDPASVEWSRWVLVFALGGFVGNFIFSLADHAQNGFFRTTEWIPVASSAFAVGFLVIPILAVVNRSFLELCSAVMIVQAVVGLLGVYYHTVANFHGTSLSMFENFVYGTPTMAPLLFPNLAALALLGLLTAPHPLHAE